MFVCKQPAEHHVHAQGVLLGMGTSWAVRVARACNLRRSRSLITPEHVAAASTNLSRTPGSATSASQRGSTRGLLLWTGGALLRLLLLILRYRGFNALFLVYIAIVSASLYGLLLVLAIDPEALRGRSDAMVHDGVEDRLRT
jgi:hypothetical protein